MGARREDKGCQLIVSHSQLIAVCSGQECGSRSPASASEAAAPQVSIICSLCHFSLLSTPPPVRPSFVDMVSDFRGLRGGRTCCAVYVLLADIIKPRKTSKTTILLSNTIVSGQNETFDKQLTFSSLKLIRKIRYVWLVADINSYKLISLLAEYFPTLSVPTLLTHPIRETPVRPVSIE